MGKPKKDQWETPPWYQTALPYALGVIAILGTLYVLGRSNPALMAAFAALGGLYAFGMQITAAVFAFKEGVTTGLLTLLCFPYALYFVFAVSENTNLKILYGTALPVVIAFKFGVIE